MISVYTKSKCPKCEVLKKKLQLNGTPFVEISLDDSQALATFKVAHPTIRAVPVTFNKDGVRVHV